MSLRLSPRDQLIAIGLAAVVVFALSVLFLFRPQFARLGQIKAEQSQEEEKFEGAKLKLKQLDAIRQQAAVIEAKRINLGRRIPKDAELPSLIIELQKMANAADFDLTSIDIKDAAEVSGYEEIPLTLTATGSFYTVVDFLYRLEEMTREVVVDDLSLTVAEYPTLTVDITARTFKLSNVEPVPPQPSGEGEQTSGEGAPPAGDS